MLFQSGHDGNRETTQSVATNFILYSEEYRRTRRNWRLAALILACLALVLFNASCVDSRHDLRTAAAVPVSTLDRAFPLDPATIAVDPAALTELPADQAYAANAALPLAGLPDAGAAPMLVKSLPALDQLRSLDCLAQAIYYEARSESEDGQRAVAQVVLNRVRHPAYPATVCGVVYQGPMRAGGGCQFTFTCDGSIAVPASGPGWLRARQIAAEALSGQVYAPVGHATHYHTLAVFPAWAPRLAKSALIGNHIFYRLPGAAGGRGAFTQPYTGNEPLPVPRQIFFARSGSRANAVRLAALGTAPRSSVGQSGYNASSSDSLPQAQPDDGLPKSTIRPEWQHSGRVKPLRTAEAEIPASTWQ